MAVNYTPLPTGAPAQASVLNSRLQELDDAIVALQADMAAAQADIVTLQTALLYGAYVTLGPFGFPTLAAGATAYGRLPFDIDPVGTSIRWTSSRYTMQRAGTVVGVMIRTDAARVAGTATVKVRKSGADFAFNGGACALDAVNTLGDSSFVEAASGLAFVAGDRLEAAILTDAGWLPITANVLVWLVVSLEPF